MQYKGKEIEDKYVAILMNDYCTKLEALKHLYDGTRVFDSIAEWIDNAKENGYYDESMTPDNIRNGCFMGIKVVEYQGNDYVVDYVL